jgi:hypothetical protein
MSGLRAANARLNFIDWPKKCATTLDMQSPHWLEHNRLSSLHKSLLSHSGNDNVPNGAASSSDIGRLAKD